MTPDEPTLRVVVGTAGHIDHGKTTLLRALTGIDADRLPEEQRRGMTIDVGYAHLDLDDGSSIDFVDVPGHDGLIGNMLVGAGEIDGAILVVAADDGPRAQTIEHLELLDALGLQAGLAVITKTDAVDAARVADVMAATNDLLARTNLAGSPVVTASAITGDGLASVRAALINLRDRITAQAMLRSSGPLRLAIDRAFSVRGRGVVVTGTFRGDRLRVGDVLHLEPSAVEVRVRGLQVHHASVEATRGGRAAVQLAGTDLAEVSRGTVLTSGPGMDSSSRVLVALRRPVNLGSRSVNRGRPAWPPADGATLRLHIGTVQVAAVVGRHGHEGADLPDDRVTAVLRLSQPIATFSGDHGVLRRPSPGDVAAGVVVLDPHPAAGITRRRANPERLAALAVTVAELDTDGVADALTALHGALAVNRLAATVAAIGGTPADRSVPVTRGLLLAPDVRDALERSAMEQVRAFHGSRPLETGMSLPALRTGVRTAFGQLIAMRSVAVAGLEATIDAVVDDLVARGLLARDGERMREAGRRAGPSPELAAGMDRLEALLGVPAPPGLADAAQRVDCPAEGVRFLETAGRIVRVDKDLAWATPTFHRLAGIALGMARRAPLTPAALRDATGTSRRYVMPLIEDLDRRGVLERTPEGHVPGPRAPREQTGSP